MLQIFYYEGNFKKEGGIGLPRVIAAISCLGVGQYLFISEYFEENYVILMYSTCTFLFAISRISQIRLNYANKSTGQSALIPAILCALGNYARLVTIFVEVNDFNVLLNMVSASFLNTTIVVQFYMYWNSSGKVSGNLDR